MRRHFINLPSLALVGAMLALGGCGGSSRPENVAVTPAPSPAPTPAPTPTPTTASVDVLPCLQQTIPTNLNRAPPGTRVIDLVIPDTITIYPELTVGFPNGRRLEDPVVDVTLAVILLDINAPGQNAASFAAIPLNPPGNDGPFRASFPFAGPPKGNPPTDAGRGTNFVFDLSPISDYVQVDRAGGPAVSTALVPSSRKIAYNDGNAQLDTAGTFAADLITGLQNLSGPLQDDIRARGLVPCAVPRAS